MRYIILLILLFNFNALSFAASDVQLKFMWPKKWSENQSNEPDPITGVVPLIYALGNASICAVSLVQGAAIDCWGSRTSIVLPPNAISSGNGSQDPYQIPNLGLVDSFGAANYSYCASGASMGSSLCWGFGGDEVLAWPAVPSTIPQTYVEAGISANAKVVGGLVHFCTDNSDRGGLYCWGEDASGLKFAAPPYGVLNDFDAFQSKTCVASDTGLACWGDEASGYPLIALAPVGLPSLLKVALNGVYGCYIIQGTPNSLGCWGTEPEISNILSYQPLLENPIDVEMGARGPCVLDQTVSGVVLKCWGQTSFRTGQQITRANVIMSQATGTLRDLKMNSYFICALSDSGLHCDAGEGSVDTWNIEGNMPAKYKDY